MFCVVQDPPHVYPLQNRLHQNEKNQKKGPSTKARREKLKMNVEARTTRQHEGSEASSTLVFNMWAETKVYTDTIFEVLPSAPHSELPNTPVITTR